MISFNNDWDILLKDEFSKPYYIKLREFLCEEYNNHTVYPDMYSIFNAFKLTAYKDIKVVILGQDPYHNEGQAHGLAFSVQKGTQIPPSLVNIYKELHSDIGFSIPSHGFLEQWAKNGVFLLNTALTVRAHCANSHSGKGWEIFTDDVIQLINKKSEPVVFMLWGANAKTKISLISNPIHLVLTAAHPSPLSAYNGFFGCKHFSKANDFLKSSNRTVDWSIKDD